MKDPEGLVLLLVDVEVEFLAMVVEVSVPHLNETRLGQSCTSSVASILAVQGDSAVTD